MNVHVSGRFGRLFRTGLFVVFLGCFRVFAQPVNDDFTNATVITNFPADVYGDNTGATAEPGEPVAGLPPQQSVWWSWTAPFTGQIAIVNDGSFANAWVKVFTGTNLTTLTNLLSNDLYVLNLLDVTNGTTYYISVDVNGQAGTGGPIHFHLENLATNDDFANATPLVGDFVEAYGDNTLATLEPGEPSYGYLNTIWWSWMAPKTETVRISTRGSAFWAFFHVFTGDSVTNLTLITSGDSQNDSDTTLNATAGTVYWIRVASSTYGTGLARIAIYPPVPPNDDFANPIVMSGDQTFAMGTTVGATAQTNDPAIDQQNSGHTVWYQWTPDKFGKVSLTITNLVPPLGIFQFYVGVFAGSQLGALQSIGAGVGGASAIVTNGQTYVFGVDGSQGDFHLGLNLTEIDIPSNDDFSNRMVLSGPSVGVTNDNTRATLEKGEHEVARHMAGGTLWYQWTAPASGVVRMVAQASGFTPVIAVYQGNSLTSLKRVVNSLQFPDTAGVYCSFETAVGQTYDIQVDGLEAGGRGPILFGIDLTSLQLVSPTNASTISAGTPPLFEINTPNPAADGQLQSVTYLAINEDDEEFAFGTVTNPPFSYMPTNLEPGLITFFALATNTEGAARISPPVLVKVRPANDEFSNSIPLGGYNWQASGYTAQATRENGEPGGGSASVWWEWTAPSSGPVTIEAQLGDEGTALRKRIVTVYTGPDVKHLRRVPWTKTVNIPDASEYFYFNAVNGTTYHVQVTANSPDLDPGTWPFLLVGSMQSLEFTTPLGQSFTEPVDVPVAITNLEDPTAHAPEGL